MGYQVIGYASAKGEYQGYAYDNVNFYVAYPDSHTQGLKTEKIKFKRSFVMLILDEYGMKLEDMVGQKIAVSYNRFGQAETFDILENNDK